MTTPYTTGTISLTNGSAVVAGIGTAWQIALIKGGIVYPEAAGNGLPISTVDSDIQITAAVEWTGATGTYSYALVRDTTYDAQIAQNAEALARLLAGLEAGTIWKYDMSGDTAGRDIYDGKPKGFSYLDVSVVPAQLWVKASNTEGDWAGPHSYGQGAQGETGPAGPAANVVFEEPETGLPGTDVEMDVTGAGTTGDPYHVTFTIPRGNPGQDGTGTGDVTGPAGSVDGHAAVFDGPTGKMLKDGGALFSGAYADLSGKPTLGGAAALNVGTTEGTVAAGNDARFSAGGSSKNEAIFALEIADLKGGRLGMVGGVADAFDDETGVNTKINAVYSSADASYKPNRTVTSVFSQTLSGGSDGLTGWTVRNRIAASRISAGGSSVRLTFQAAGALTISKMYIGVPASSGQVYDFAATPTAVTFDGGSPSKTVSAAGDIVSDVINFPLGTSQDLIVSYYITGATSGAWQSGATGVDSYRKNADDAATVSTGGGYTASTTSARGIKLIEVVGAYQNMTLVSVGYSAATVPVSGRVAVQVVPTDAITINTDLIAKLSRDGGTTWATAVLSLSQSLIGPKIYEATGIDLSSLPSGTSMKWEIDTANNKNVAVSGVVMQWS